MDDFVASLTSQARDTLRAALGKKSRGQKLNTREASIVERYERSLDAERRRRIYSTIPQKDWIGLSGRQAKVLNEQEARYGVPVGRANIDLRSLAVWVHEAIASGRIRAIADDGLDMAGENSPGLERYRIAKAQLAEIDLDLRRSRLLDRETLEAQWNAGAVALRNAGERLQRRFGDEAASLYNEGVADFARAVTEAINAGHAPTSTGDPPGDVGVAGVAPGHQPPPVDATVRGAGARRAKRSLRGDKVSD